MVNKDIQILFELAADRNLGFYIFLLDTLENIVNIQTQVHKPFVKPFGLIATKYFLRPSP